MLRCCIHSTLNSIQDHTVNTCWQWRVSNPHTLSPLSAIISLPKAINSFIETVTYLQYTGLFISHSGISKLDCATTKTGTAERSISIGRESLQVFFVLGALAYFQVPPQLGSRDEKWRSQWIRKCSVSWNLQKLSQLWLSNGGFGSCTTQNHLQT